MTVLQTTDSTARQLILKQAELVALEVAKAEAIVEVALVAAAMAMSIDKSVGSLEATESAKEILQVARNAAAKVLQVARTEAEVTLRMAKDLAILRLIDEGQNLDKRAPMLCIPVGESAIASSLKSSNAR